VYEGIRIFSARGPFAVEGPSVSVGRGEFGGLKRTDPHSQRQLIYRHPPQSSAPKRSQQRFAGKLARHY